MKPRSVIDWVFLVSAGVIALSAAAFPWVAGYGTVLFQFVAFGGWFLVYKVTSGEFADQHLGLVLLVGSALNVLMFGIIAIPTWLLLRARQGRIGIVTLLLWAFFYLASLFWLFPATDGP